ncbi:MAG: hypothetical protein ACK5YP_09420 [Betaproteobacteria bacterium]
MDIEIPCRAESLNERDAACVGSTSSQVRLLDQKPRDDPVHDAQHRCQQLGMGGASLAILAVVDRSGELAVFVTLRFVPASASFRTSTMYRQTYRQSLRQAMRLWQLCASHAPFVMLICIIFDENAAHENNRHH